MHVNAFSALSPAARIAAALGGARRVGAGWICRCCSHEDRIPSLSLRDTAEGELLMHCFANCSFFDIARELQRRGLLLKQHAERLPTSRAVERRSPIVDASKLNYLLALLKPIEDTPVETYLASRDLDLPPAGHALRYLPAKPPQYPWPCMVGIVSALDDAASVLTLHFTRLKLDGSGKAPLPKNECRSFLAGFPKKGGVIRLSDDADVTTDLALAEGAETALAVHSSFRRSGWFRPVWAGLDAGNLRTLSTLRGVDRLFIYADRGRVGEQAAETLAQRWVETGHQAFICLAPSDDWNLRAAS